MANDKVQHSSRNINICVRDLFIVPYDQVKSMAQEGWQIVMLKNVTDHIHPHLTPREKECLKLYIQGKVPKEIASMMHIKNSQTINTMLSTIKKKFNVTSSHALISKVYVSGFNTALEQ